MKKGDTVGSFTLGSILGRGGMASVHLGAHTSDGTQVAVKVLEPKIAKQEHYIGAFAHEVRAAARLNHSRITAVYDHGVVSATEAGSRSEFAGAPWLAMELVEGGTLSSVVGQLTWPEYKRVILDVLDALAHSHARGLIHRDIKPGNVLLDERTRRIKLTDFGLVLHAKQAISNDEAEEMVSGTPSYMAPEQFLNQRNAFGPWTDLYSVGITAWHLACGRVPYSGEVFEVFQKHLWGELPLFEPLLPMPPGLLDWLEAMLAPKSHHRFQCAADAAWGLKQIEPHTSISTSSSDFLSPASDGVNEADLEPGGVALRDMATEILDPDEINSFQGQRFKRGVQSPLTLIRPPLPTDWRTHRQSRTHLHGAGLALFSLRTTGVVGRESARDHLWQALRRVTETRQVECVLIEGASGIGTSTLAQWLTTRAHEVGGALCRTATHGSIESSSDGLSGLLCWSLPIHGLPRAEAISKVQEHLAQLGMDDRDDAIGLVHIARPDEEVEAGLGLTAHFSTQAERLTLLSRYLVAHAEQRPLILWLDELHHAPESMALVENLLQGQPHVPLMVLGTVATEDVHEGTELAHRFEALGSRPQTSRIELKPLDTDGQVALIRELLGLDLALAATVEQRSGGNPQFAVQLVSDWVERGLLVPSDAGFTLKPGADTAIPNDMIAMWRQRLAGALANRSSSETWALELGAMLGTEVHREEWEDAIALAEIRPCAALMSELQRQRLIIPNPEGWGWSFVHTLFHAAVLEYIESSGRTERWANIAAEILPPGNHSIARRARLLVAADRTEEALGPLSKAIIYEASRGDYARARQLFEFRLSILEDFPIDERGAHALATAVCQHFLLQHDVRYAEAQRVGPELIAWAEECQAWDFVSRLKLDYGTSFLNGGNAELGTPHIADSLEIARNHRLPTVGTILNRMSYIAERLGRLDEAATCARNAIHAEEMRGNVNGVGHAYLNLSHICWQAGDLERATYHSMEATERFERIGSRLGLAEAYNNSGAMARSRGDYSEAERAYLEAAARYRGCGSSNHRFAELNLALTYVETGRFPEAGRMLHTLHKSLPTKGSSQLMLWLRLCTTCCLASEAAWTELEPELQDLGEAIQSAGIFETDAANAARICADLCEEQGRSDIARLAWAIVAHQLHNLERSEEAQVIEAKMQS